MSNYSIEQILQEFTQKNLGIEGIALVSADGQLLANPIGLETDSILILAGSLLQMADNFQTQLDWQQTQQISLRSKEGYLNLIPCLDEVFLLVKSANNLSGLLNHELNQMIKVLQAQLQPTPTTDPYSVLATEESGRSPQTSFSLSGTSSIDPVWLERCQGQLAEYIGPMASLICRRLAQTSPNLAKHEFIDKLLSYIPDSQMALQFEQQLLSPEIPQSSASASSGDTTLLSPKFRFSDF